MFQKCSLSLIFFLTVIAGYAQFRKIPAEVTDAFKAKYANASGVSWKDRLSSFEAGFTFGGKKMKAFFSSKGEWLKSETKHTYSSLPLEVKDGFKKSKYAQYDVLDITQIDEKDKGVQFKILTKRKEYGKKQLVFSKNGQLLSDNIAL